MSNLILDIKNITKSFPKVIANNKVTFGIKKNSVHAILGENGAGNHIGKNFIWFLRAR